MALPGFFLEYLITGSCALVWLFGLFRHFDVSPPSTLPAAYIALLAPALYVVGMLIDFCFGQPLSALSKYLQRRAQREKPTSDVYTSRAKIWLRSTDLGKQLEIRSSRDHVARGAVGNLLIGTIVATIVARSAPGRWWYVVLIGGVFLTCLALAMWFWFAHLTFRFEQRAAAALTKLGSTNC